VNGARVNGARVSRWGHRNRILMAAAVVVSLGFAGCASQRSGSVTGAKGDAAQRSPSVPGPGRSTSSGPAGTSGAPSGRSSASGSVKRSRTGRAPAGATGRLDLTDPRKKELAMRLVSSAENSSLDWRAQYAYIQDIDDGRGYTAGVVGFCSGTGDMVKLVERYTARSPGNRLARYLPALRGLKGSESHDGLDPTFTTDWKAAAADPLFQQAQEAERDALYFNPAVTQAKQDGLRALGQFAYYDALVMHGASSGPRGFDGIRKAALSRAESPAQGGAEAAYLEAFLDARAAAMATEEGHRNTSRVETAQRLFLRAGNLDLNPPLAWKVYNDSYAISG
jgi:chitosanase